MKELLSEFIFLSKYSRFNETLQRRETYDEIARRVFDMHRTKYRKEISENGALEGLLGWAEQIVLEKKVLPSMRSMQFAGDAVLSKNERIYNCVASYVDRVSFFKQAAFLLLCGNGVGYSVQKQHIEKLPAFPVNRENNKEELYVVEDSIEGWAEAFDYLIQAYLGENFHPVFDFSNIRPKGSPILKGIGVSPGALPLIKALKAVETIMEEVASKGGRMSPLNAHDIICHISNCVASGGTRRSALISIFSKDDEDMIDCKTGSWWVDNEQRGRANNSALLIPDDCTREELIAILEKSREFGDPGLLFAFSQSVLTNPCGEIGIWAQTEDGETGWQFCNLSTINLSTVTDMQDFLERCTVCAIIGTLQAGYTDFSERIFGVNSATKRITEREALLGCSLTGLLDSPFLKLQNIGDDFDSPELVEVLSKGSAKIKSTNKMVAMLLNINPAARTTCIKPEGTGSLVLGTTSGIHPAEANYYVRNVQGSSIDPTVQKISEQFPQMITKNIDVAEGNNDVIVQFAIEQPCAITKRDVTALGMLRLVKLIQENWVDGGKNEDLCVHPKLSHNVSNTITYQSYEWDSLLEFIYDNRATFAGITLLSSFGAHAHRYAPFCEVGFSNMYSTLELINKVNTQYKLGEEDVTRAYTIISGIMEVCDGSLDIASLEELLGVHSANLPFIMLIREVAYNLKFQQLKAAFHGLPKIHLEKYHLGDEEVYLTETVACAGGACEII